MRLSIIVCTRNRAQDIEACLASIAVTLGRASPIDAELIVIDNGSTDDTSARVEAWAELQSFPVRLIYEPRAGLSVARNTAIRAARGDLLAFTDDDCRMSPDYVVELLRHDAQDQGLVLRGGRVALGRPDDLPLSIKMQAEPQTWVRAQAVTRHENLGDSLMGCSFTMRRELAEKLGPFDENLGAGSPIPGAEDTDYVYRAYLAGATIAYVPDMAITHFHGRKTAAEGNRLFRNYALGWGALYAKYLFRYPGFCRPLVWDVKNALKEIATGRNQFMPSVGFSHKDKVLYSLWGAAKYLRTSLLHIDQRRVKP